jgi:hypothetical protein
MSRALIIGLGSAAVMAAVSIGAPALWWRPPAPAPSGASVTVLVDFSHSFIPVRRQGDLSGLFDIDRHALRSVARSLAQLSWGTWKPPVKIVWSPITAGATEDPFCPPLVIDVGLTAKMGPEDIERELFACVDEIVQASKDYRRLAPYTDISAAVAGAATPTPATYGENVLVVLSDFKEDLADGKTPAHFSLPGYRVILLHRAGTDEREGLHGYLARVNRWKDPFGGGAGPTPAVVPVFGATSNRVRLALHPDPLKPMTWLTILVDSKNSVVRGTNPTARRASLLRLANELVKLPEAKAWKPPITAQWAVMTSTGLGLLTQPAAEFDPTELIPTTGQTAADFAIAMEESANWASNAPTTSAGGDMLGSVELISSVEPAPNLHVVVILSDFASPPPAATFRPPQNSRFVLLHTPGPDGDESEDSKRRQAWMNALGGNKRVCLIPMATWTSIDLGACFTTGSRTSE